MLLILFAIVSAEIGELSAQSDDSQNLEQVIQKLDQLNRRSNLWDGIIATFLGGLILAFVLRFLGYGKEIRDLVEKVRELDATVKKLRVRVSNIETSIGIIWVFVAVIAVFVIACTIDLIARHT